MDRFLMRLSMGYPAYPYEMEILKAPNMSYDGIALEPVVTRQEVQEIQHFVPRVYTEESVLDYILQIIQATRTETEFRSGVSTRGTISLRLAAQARALYDGRGFVTPDDVREMVLPVLVHRISLRRQTSDALEERQAVEGILTQMLNRISAPT